MGRSSKMQEFIDWKYKSKKDFLEEKIEKQGNVKKNVDEEENEQSKSQTEQDQNTYTTNMQMDKHDQQGIATGEKGHKKVATQTPVKYFSVNIELSTNTSTKNTQSTVVTTIFSIDTTPITSIPGRLVSTYFNFDSIQPT